MAKVGYRLPHYKRLDAAANVEAKQIGKGVKCDVSINAPEAKLYGDDGVAESVREFVDGTITAEFDDIENEDEAELTGATLAETGELVRNEDDTPPYVRYGYINKHIRGGKTSWRATIYHKVQFAHTGETNETKGQNTTFQTVTLTGTLYRDDDGNWKTQKELPTLTEAVAFMKATVKGGAGA